MAITSETNQVTWGAANAKAVASSATEMSDDYTFNANTFDSELIVKADNAGTPANGDVINIYAQIKEDPDQDAAPEYANQGDLVGRLDTNSVDPAIKGILFSPMPGKTYRFAAKNEGASSITVSIRIVEKKSA